MQTPAVLLEEADQASGMAQMLGGLLEDNLRDYPSRARVASRTRGKVVLTASDRDLSVTLTFGDGRVIVSDGAANGAPLLAGPWLELAKLCSGQTSPVAAAARRELRIHPRGRPDLLAAAGFVLSVPQSYYDDNQRRKQVLIVLTLGTAVVIVAVLVVRQRRRATRTG